MENYLSRGSILTYKLPIFLLYKSNRCHIVFAGISLMVTANPLRPLVGPLLSHIIPSRRGQSGHIHDFFLAQKLLSLSASSLFENFFFCYLIRFKNLYIYQMKKPQGNPSCPMRTLDFTANDPQGLAGIETSFQLKPG